MKAIQQAIFKMLDALEAVHAVVSPGSRNALVISSLMNANYQLHGVIDERSAGFQALGMAKTLNQAVVLSCTSGTAALNYYPAIAEAFYARIPLIAITADRPNRLIDQWDGQAIRQNKVFAQHCRLSLQCPEAGDEKAYAAIAEEVNQYLEEGIKGPVHINLPIDEPFYEQEQLQPKTADRHFISSESIMLLDIDDYIPLPNRALKVLVVNGMEDGQLMIVQCKDSKSYEQLVVLSDVLANQASSLLHWDALLYSLMRNEPEKAAVLQADLLITTGTTTVSKGLKQFLKRYPPEKHFHITRHREVGDPFQSSPIIIDPYSPSIKGQQLKIDSGYYKQWLQYSVSYTQVLFNLDWAAMHEFSAVKRVLSKLPASAILHLANSTAVRYASFLVDELDALEVMGNRGTSGIDGCTSTAVGSAMVTDQAVYLLSGDIAFLYDQNALLRTELPGQLKIIVLNNQGGRIFEYIDGPERIPERLHYQITEHNIPLERVCQQYGLQYICASDLQELDQAMDELQNAKTACVLEVVTEPQKNKQFFEQFKNIRYE